MEKPINADQAIELTISDEIDHNIIKDPMELPGILKKAKEHGSAQKVLRIPNDYSAEYIEFCECCNLPIETKGIIEPFPFCVDIKELSNCGVGTFLYFFFMKYITWSLIIVLGMFAIPTILISKSYSNDLLDFCKNSTLNNYTLCNRYSGQELTNKTDWLYQMSYENLNTTIQLMRTIKVGSSFPLSNFDDNVVDFNFLNFLTMVVLFLVNIIFIVIVHNLIQEADFEAITPSDFSLKISNIEEKFKDLDELKYEILEVNDIIPIDVNLTFRLDDYFTDQQTLKILNQKYKNLKSSNKDFITSGCLFKKIEYKDELKIQIQTKRENIKNYLNQIDKISDHPELFNGVVFASFKNTSEYEKYFSIFPHSFLGAIWAYTNYVFANYLFCCLYSNKKRKQIKKSIKFRVERSPEPSDVIWENLQYTEWQKFKRIFIVYFISGILICLSFLIILSINYLQWISQKSYWFNNLLIKYLMSCLISMVVSMVNYIFTTLMTKLTNYEKVDTLTDFYLSHSLKLTIFTFINSAIVPLVSNIRNYGWTEKDILINNLLIIFLSNAFVTPMIYASNMWYLLRKWKRKALEKKFVEDEPINNITQKELNQLYENPDIAISYKYSYIVKTFLMSAFYLPLFPLGSLISLIGLILMYLIEKFNLINTYKRPDMLNSQICIFYIKNFKFLIFTTALGNKIFLFNMWEINKFSVISITIFSILLIIPYHRFFKWKCLGVKETDVLKKSYLDCYFDFATHYERQNPITKKKGNHRYLERLMEEGIITQEMFLDLSQKLDSENVNIMELYYRRSANVQTKLKDSVAQMFKIKTMRTRGKTQLNLAQGLFSQANGDLRTNDRVTCKKTRALENLVLSILPKNFVFNNLRPKKNELQNENNIHIKTEQSEGKNKKIDLFKKYKENNQKQKVEQEIHEQSNFENPFTYSNNNQTNSQELILMEKDNKNYLKNNYPEGNKIENHKIHENYENTAFSGININHILASNYQVPKPQSDNPVNDNQIELYNSNDREKDGQQGIENSSPANLNYIDGQQNYNSNIPKYYYNNQN